MYKNYRFALSGAVTVLVGIFIGYLMFSSSLNHRQTALVSQNANPGKNDEGKIKVENIQVTPSPAGNGEVEIKLRRG